MFNTYSLPPSRFVFGSGEGADKYRGLQQFGPYRGVSAAATPTFGFVFPNEFKDYANKLFLALKNGLGYFRGLETTFRVPLSKDQVFSVTGFSIPGDADPRRAARIYADAIISWSSRATIRPDIFYVLHRRTSSWEDETPYYECKALLLEEGILSQAVTIDLIDNPSQFEWSIANIALATFAKLGGVPWVVGTRQQRNELVIGVGRADLFDPRARQSRRTMGFTACFSPQGLFEFVCLADIARSKDEYLRILSRLVSETLKRAVQRGTEEMSLVVHLPKDISREESDVIRQAVSSSSRDLKVDVCVIRVNDEDEIFAVDLAAPDGVPSRGTVVQTGNRTFVLYTEGREEKSSWRQRMPTALRVTHQMPDEISPQRVAALISQVNDLSQVNWRGFNARSRPISTYYGHLIANILSHVPESISGKLYLPKAKAVLENKMWFL